MTHIEIAAAVIVGVLSVARTARLLIWDEYPPTIWLRIKWDDATGDSGWNKLMHCQFCLTPYLAAGMALWFWLSYGYSDWEAFWWIVNGVWGLSYLSAILVSYDDGVGG